MSDTPVVIHLLPPCTVNVSPALSAVAEPVLIVPAVTPVASVPAAITEKSLLFVNVGRVPSLRTPASTYTYLDVESP